GLCLIGRASFVIFSRTSSARRANKKSCAAYAAGGPPVATDNEGIKAGVSPVRPPAAKDPRFARRKKLAMRAAREFGFVAYVAFAALLAVPMTSGTAFNQQRKIEISPGIFVKIAVSPDIVIKVVVLYIIVRSIYVLIARIVELVSAKKDDTPTGNEAIPPANAQSVERIRMAYDPGRLHATTYTVVFLAVLETFFVVAFTQGPLLPVPRIFISLFLGGLYPALSSRVLALQCPPPRVSGGQRGRRWVGWDLYRDALSSRGVQIAVFAMSMGGRRLRDPLRSEVGDRSDSGPLSGPRPCPTRLLTLNRTRTSRT
ncbi:MAG: hypothetical protein ACLQLO_09365, partial [Mycobacterium sp.]